MKILFFSALLLSSLASATFNGHDCDFDYRAAQNILIKHANPLIEGGTDHQRWLVALQLSRVPLRYRERLFKMANTQSFRIRIVGEAGSEGTVIGGWNGKPATAIEIIESQIHYLVSYVALSLFDMILIENGMSPRNPDYPLKRMYKAFKALESEWEKTPEYWRDSPQLLFAHSANLYYCADRERKMLAEETPGLDYLARRLLSDPPIKQWKGVEQREFRDSNNVVSYYRIKELPRASAENSDILVYLHGDGFSYDTSHPDHPYWTQFKQLADVARSYGMSAAVSALSPNTTSWRAGLFTGEDGNVYEHNEVSGHVPYLSELLSKLGVDKTTRRAHLVGISGGATFITRDYLPTQLNNMQKFASVTLLCGGVVRDGADEETDQAFTTPINFVYNVVDPVVGAFTARTIDHYKKLGFDVNTYAADEKGHCTFDIPRSLNLALFDRLKH